MPIFYNSLVVYVLQVLFIVLCVLGSIFGRRFPEGGYFPGGYYDRQEHENKIKTALERLEHAPQWVPEWPESSVKLGQVSGVAIDNAGRVLLFHRANNVWDGSAFNDRNVYQNIGEPPIPQPTILVFNDSGSLVDMWGKNLFYMPHGITVDKDDNVWVTDVAMHQVFKFTPQQREKPALVLGEKFVPRDDDTHFCKPSAVAVLPSGDFFVADGYCNARIIKFAPDGTRILQWGRHLTGSGDSPFTFLIPHALTLAEDKGLVCVADRERGRAACFRADNGTFVQQYRSWLIGPRLFSLAYAPVHGGRLYIVNGPTPAQDIPVRGYVIDFTSGRLIQSFAPDHGLSNPHDIAVSPDGSKVYVAEISPYRAYKFVDEELRNESRKENVTHVKPTATVELNPTVAGPSGNSSSAPWGGGALGGAAAAAGAALLAAAAVALLTARNKGRKGMTRRRWEYGNGEFKLRRLLERRRFTRVHSDDSDEEPSPMLPPPQPPANA